MGSDRLGTLEDFSRGWCSLLSQVLQQASNLFLLNAANFSCFARLTLISTCTSGFLPPLSTHSGGFASGSSQLTKDEHAVPRPGYFMTSCFPTVSLIQWTVSVRGFGREKNSSLTCPFIKPHPTAPQKGFSNSQVRYVKWTSHLSQAYAEPHMSTADDFSTGHQEMLMSL